MGSPQENTKIEQLTEAIESLVTARVACTVRAGGSPVPDYEREVLTRGVEIAREEVASALRELLRPTLRVVTAEPT